MLQGAVSPSKYKRHVALECPNKQTRACFSVYPQGLQDVKGLDEGILLSNYVAVES